MDAVTTQRSVSVSRHSPPLSRRITSPTMVSANSSSQLLYKLERPVYNSPPPVSNNPENNVCKMIEYRSAKIAAFTVDGRELICLPQAFDLFLKHLVGGLHTVYTKLKRLDITPVVCNVEQVRVLRGLGAIQPGVNRCKLISPKEFDILYDDCTNSSARPGRPPKRSSLHAVSPETLQRLKKSKIENGSFPFPDEKTSPLLSSGYNPYPPHLAMFPFMPYGHPLTHPAVSMAMANQFSLPHDKLFFNKDRQIADTELLSTRLKGEAFETGSNHSNHSSDGHNIREKHDKSEAHRIACTNGELDLSLPKKQLQSTSEEDSDDISSCPAVNDHYSDLDDSEKDEVFQAPIMNPTQSETSLTDISLCKATNNNSVFSTLNNETNTGISSIDTLLQNIQGLLNVATENARHHQNQVNTEKAELKMELLKEREMRENLEKQLQEYQKTIAILEKKWKKEKKSRKRLQQQMESIANKPKSVSPNTLNRHRSSPESKLNEEGLPSDRSDQESQFHDRASSLMPSMMGNYLSQAAAAGGCAPNNSFIHQQMMKKETVA